MAKRVGVDKWLFGTVLLLVLFGLVMVVFSVGGDGARRRSGFALPLRGEAGAVGAAGNGR